MPRIALATLLVLLVLVSSALGAAPSAGAANVACVASPTSGPPGTTFGLTASGFTPNANLWTYAVDPSGAAFADPANQAFGGGVRASSFGVASFPFITRYVETDTGTVVARALGRWTLVIQELGANRTIVHEAHCVVTLTASNAPLSGAQLAVSPTQGFSDQVFIVAGVGFAPGEIVNLWLTPPPNCDAFAYSLAGTITFGAAANAFSYGSAKTDASGTFGFQILPSTPSFCTGQWAVSARAPGSGRGGIARFLITGHPVTPNGAILTVNPAATVSRGGQLTFTGSDYAPGEVVNCWYTRPEGNVREVPNSRADGAGSFSFVLTTGFDGISGTGTDMQYSEGALGAYVMSCLGQSSHRLALAQFTLYGGLSDP